MFAMHQSDLIKYSDEHIKPARRKSPSDETKKKQSKQRLYEVKKSCGT